MIIAAITIHIYHGVVLRKVDYEYITGDTTLAISIKSSFCIVKRSPYNLIGISIQCNFLYEQSTIVYIKHNMYISFDDLRG